MNDTPLLYVMPQTRAGTVQWMNEELGSPCNIKLINLRAGEGQTPDYLAINPMGKLPALAHKGNVVTEVAAICAYLADQFPEKGLAPAPQDPLRGLYYRWMFFAPSCIEPAMLDKLGGVERANAAATGHGTMPSVLQAIDVALSKGPYLLGDNFSAADIVFGSTLRFATMFGAITKEGRISDYVDHLSERAAFKASLAAAAQQMKDMGLE